MSTLSILGQLMGGLVPPQGAPAPYDAMAAGKERAASQTALIGLEELKRQQASEAQVRQFMAQHPELFMGQGQPQQPQSVLGGAAGQPPMMQQSVMPGQPQGAPQLVPGGQDLSRFAGQGTPPTGSTLGQPGPPQQGQDPLMALMRTNPDAAQAVQQRVQQFQERRLTWEEKRMGYFGQVLQGVNDEESYQRGRQEIARVDPHAASQLPPTYDKDKLLPYIKQALSVKDSATLQLETMKVGAQMAQLGLQGMTPSVVTQLKADGKDPRTATPSDITDALGKIRASEVEQKEKEGLAASQARTEGEKQARLDKTVSEAFGERTTKLFDAQTGQTVDSRMKVKDYEAMPACRVKELSAHSTEIMENVNNAIPIVAQLQTYMDKIYGPGGILARMTPEDRSLWSSWTDSTAATSIGAQFMQKYPELTQAQRFLDSNAGALARAIAGEKGAMAEGDVERAKAMMPNLKTAFTVWPPSALGATLPDTRAVALRTMNSMVDTINARMKTLLGNEQFAHPKLRRYETAEDAQTAAGGTVTAPPVEPPGGPAPTPPPAAGPPLFPRPQIRIPGEEPAPALPTTPTARPTSPAPAPSTRPAPPTATSTPAQDAAYQQWQQQQTPPAPAPGRQSQAPGGGLKARLAGGPKFMDLADVAEAIRQTGKSRREVEAAARSKGYTVYGSKLPLPEETMVG